MNIIKILFRKLYHRVTKHIINPVKNPNATEFEIDNWVISDFVLEKLIPCVGVHPFPLNELMLIAGSVCRFRPEYIFEWGTHVGKSARVFHETAKHFKIPVEIHSIDLPEEVEHVEHPHSERGKLVRRIKSVKLHLGDGLDTALKICKALPANSRILFLVDGDHSYESVKRELTGIIANVPGAKILVHDTFYQSDDSGYNIGPYKAVKEAVTSGKHKLIETRTGLPGMSLLY